MSRHLKVIDRVLRQSMKVSKGLTTNQARRKRDTKGYDIMTEGEIALHCFLYSLVDCDFPHNLPFTHKDYFVRLSSVCTVCKVIWNKRAGHCVLRSIPFEKCMSFLYSARPQRFNSI